MDTYEEKLKKLSQSYNKKLGIDDKKQMEDSNKSVFERLREMFGYTAPPPAKKKKSGDSGTADNDIS
jgi:hypothetical protein